MAAPFRNIFHLRSRRRLQTEIELARTVCNFRFARNQGAKDTPRDLWRETADKALKQAEQNLQNGDWESGWRELHTAMRFACFGLRDDELQMYRVQLVNEAIKINPWRRDTIFKILEGPKTSAEAIAMAMEVRDDYSATQYHRIWLREDQIKVLLYVCAITSLLYLAMNSSYGIYLVPDWSRSLNFTPAKVSTALMLGLSGSVLSILRSLMNFNKDLKIPESLTNQSTTIARLLSGAIAGLVGYIFWIESLVPLKDSVRPYLAIPLIFGYVGESLVTRISSSLIPHPAKDRPTQT
jgi:hypothetical protein